MTCSWQATRCLSLRFCPVCVRTLRLVQKTRILTDLKHQTYIQTLGFEKESLGCKPTILWIWPSFLLLLKIMSIHIFWRWQQNFPQLISRSSWILNGKKTSCCALQKMLYKTCWGSKSQILYEEGSNWRFLQSPNLTRNMHLYALYFPYVCCWCSGFSVAIVLDRRVVGFSDCFSPVKWMVLQQQHILHISPSPNMHKRYPYLRWNS